MMLHYNQKIKYAKFLEYSVKIIIRLSFVESGAIIHTKSLITFKDRKVTNNFIFISARFPQEKQNEINLSLIFYIIHPLKTHALE